MPKSPSRQASYKKINHEKEVSLETIPFPREARKKSLKYMTRHLYNKFPPLLVVARLEMGFAEMRCIVSLRFFH